jgi:cell division protein FtsB
MYRTVIVTLMIFYCLYNIFAGSRGLITTLDIDQIILEKKETLAQLQIERSTLENKLKSFKQGNIDLDYLEELAKSKLGLADPQELVLITGDLR